MRAVPGTKQSSMKIDVTPGGRRVLTKTQSVELKRLPVPAQNSFDDSIESSLISSSKESVK